MLVRPRKTTLMSTCILPALDLCVVVCGEEPVVVGDCPLAATGWPLPEEEGPDDAVDWVLVMLE